MTRFAHFKAFQWDKMVRVSVPRKMGMQLVGVNFVLFCIFFCVLIWMGEWFCLCWLRSSAFPLPLCLPCSFSGHPLSSLCLSC
jgi:hypothetical protein